MIQSMKGDQRHKLKGFRKSREKGSSYVEEKEKLKAENKSFPDQIRMKENEMYSTIVCR